MFPRPTPLAVIALAGVATASLAGMLQAAETPATDTIQRMLGRWAGDAEVIPTSGPAQSYKCVVTYRNTGNGGVAQNLRCKRDGYSLEAATLLSIDGQQVTGQWEDRINAVGGDVRGTVTAAGFDVHLGGKFFEAKLQVAGSGCHQQVKLTPVRAEYIKELSANLKKC